MKITSDIFQEKEIIPAKYTCDGSNINPRLLFEDVPKEAKTLALIMDDPDATDGKIFTHWTMWNISPDTKEIAEQSAPNGAVEGETDFGVVGYGGPCPPKGVAPHRYFFKLYALDKPLCIPAGAQVGQLKEAMRESIIEEAEYVGLYGRR
ncbi:MAG: YbhB/YbcL family Raf kinase inhibitor-like protein [Parcubacteria group bacterium]|nr:YbhB/YbcL family Raf kinase inhibitor-like protein [Parcubacteria group bacterium]